MFYIDDTYSFELNINKSKFIAVLSSVNSIEEVNTVLNNIKKQYCNANHYCYAFIIDSYSKYSDDSEPSGSAGSPILNVLAKNKLNHVVCIVVRYFGGVKLGFGGLVRAYTNSTLGTIKKAPFITLEDAFYIEILINYDNIKKIEFLLNKASIILKEFDLNIRIGFNISKTNYDLIKHELLLISKVELVKNIGIKKSV